MLELYTSFNTTLGPLHEDYEDRVIRLVTGSSVSDVEVYIVGAIDVAISKLGRFGARDQEDIQALLRLPQVDFEEFERLANEAIDYYVGNRMPFLGNFKVVMSDYHRKTRVSLWQIHSHKSGSTGLG